MKKDSAILDLLDSLVLEARGWEMRDHWESDLCAIGVASKLNPNRLVYICTFKKPANTYYYECEELSGMDNYTTVDEGDFVGYLELVQAMENHLGVNEGDDEANSKTAMG